MTVGGPRHLYVHVPFCRAKCDYCEFFSVPAPWSGVGAARPRLAAAGGARSAGARGARLKSGDAEPVTAGAGPVEGGAERGAPRCDDPELDRYVSALLAELDLERAAVGIGRLRTVFLGGGTPSLLGEERLERLLRALEPLLTSRAEVSVETNPEDVTPAYAEWAAHRGVRPAFPSAVLEAPSKPSAAYRLTSGAPNGSAAGLAAAGGAGACAGGAGLAGGLAGSGFTISMLPLK